MSALAQVLADWGESVQGSDVEQRFFTQDRLELKSIPIVPFHTSTLEDVNVCVLSTAFLNHAEAQRAKEKGVQVYYYQEMLGKLIEPFDSIAVSGTHGKTTTSTLIAHVLRKIQPINAVIGDGTGEGNRDSKWFVLEACEYRRHFLSYEPSYAVITNIDYDHPDYYEGLDDVCDAFQQFALQTKKCVIVNGDDEHASRISARKVRTFGFGQTNHVYAKDINFLQQSGTQFSVVIDGEEYVNWHIPLYGQHNVLNALACVAVLSEAGMPIEDIRNGLADVSGAKRRFSETKVGDLILIDDYAHHPSEIRATIQAARDKYPDQKVISVFQPHTYSRVQAFVDQFADELQKSDEVYVCDVFASEREKSGTHSAGELVRRMKKAKLLHGDDLKALAGKRDCVILFMGAGDIGKYQNDLIQMLTMRGVVTN